MLNRHLSYVLLAAAGTFVLWRGVLPAFTHIDTDFPNYYAAGALARTGTNVERLYDDAWFQNEIYRLGMNQQGKFSPFPPPTALLFIPFSFLPPLTALQVMSILNLLCLGLSVHIIRRLFDFSLLHSTLFVMLSGWGLANCFRFGQLYLALSLSMLAAVSFRRRSKCVIAGICIGSLLPIKYFSVLLLLNEILKRRWQTVLACVATVVAIFAISILILGWEIHRVWLFSVLGAHLQADLSGQDVYSFTFQSFRSLFRRLFLFDPLLNPNPWIDSTTAYHLATAASLLFPLALTIRAILRVKDDETLPELSVAILLTAGLLVAPATATYHFVLLWLPVGILLQRFSRSGQTNLALATVTCYTAIGFLPYSLFQQFDGAGLLTLLAYPRLFLMTALFGLSLLSARSLRAEN